MTTPPQRRNKSTTKCNTTTHDHHDYPQKVNVTVNV
jgi:hypothetical protein